MRRHVHGRPPGFFVGAACVALCLIVLVLPSPYVMESPGPTRNVLGSIDGTPVLSVSGVSVHRGAGRLLMTTVNATGVPGYYASTLESMVAWFLKDRTVLPSEAVFPVGQTADEYRSESDGQMTSSEDSATKAALAFARTSLGMDVDGVKVTMHTSDIGGPSAGMMYALGIIDALTAADETGGLTIAGTGTMSATGKVGAIGGIRLKMLGAKRDGATWFLAPASNCDEVVGHVPSGLRDVRVSTLAGAYKALVAIGEGKGSDLPHCTA
nr:S16 family serine protease [uncultured Bifidobacterium sp.]